MAAEPPPPPSLQQQLAEVEAEAEDEGCSPLAHAAATGRHDVLTHLLCTAAGGSDGDSDNQRDRAAALLAAAEHGHVRCPRVPHATVPGQAGAGRRVGGQGVESHGAG